MKRTTRTWGWLVEAAARRTMRVTAMARRTVAGAMMAAALVLGMTACSSDDTIAEEPVPQQPANAAVTADGKVHVTVGAGIGDDGETRSAVVKDGKKRRLTFTLPVGNKGDANYSPGDRLYICGDIESNVRRMCGLLTIKSLSEDGKSATFEGKLTVKVKDGDTWKDDESAWADEQTGDPMTWYGDNGIKCMLIHAATTADAPIYSYYVDGGFDFNHDKSLVTGDGDLANKLMESAIYVSGSYDKSEGRFKLRCSDTIFNCTFSGLDKNSEYHVCIRMSNSIIYDQAVNTDGDGTARFAISSNLFSGNDEKFLQLSPDGNFNSSNTNLLSCSLGNIRFSAKVYNLSRYWNGTTFQKLIDLSKFEDYYTANDGDVLTGELPTGSNVEIPDGATVTLLNASIDSYGSGINCFFDGDGDNATIILVGTNTVKGSEGEPGIYVPEGFTLTIKGSGSLTAEGSTVVNGEIKKGGAGIGGPPVGGNVIIEGGTVTAIGGYGAPGIGGLFKSDHPSSFGTITIKNTVTSVTATKGTGAPYCIGPSKDGACGKITFDDFEVYDHTGWTHSFEDNFTPSSEVSVGGMNFTVNEAGDTWTLTPKP